MDLRRLLTIARPWWLVLVVGTLVGAVLGAALSSIQARTYEAKTTLIVGQSLTGDPDFNQILVSQRLSATYAAVATTRPILDAVIAELGLETDAEQLIRRVRSSAPLDSTLLTLWAQDPDPQRAADIANRMAERLVEVSPTIQGRQDEFQAAIDEQLDATLSQIESTQDQVEALTAVPDRTPAQNAELAALENRLANLRSTYATLLTFSSNSSSGILSVIEPAVPPLEPISPRPVLNVLLGALLGLLAVAIVAAFVTYVRDVIRDPDEVQEVLGLATLGIIAQQEAERGRSEVYRLVTLLYPRSSIAEEYRTLRVNTEFAEVDAPIRTLLVTSSMPGEGKTVVSSNLAVAYAQSGRKVLLVDADLRKPGLNAVLGLPNVKGLTALLRDERLGVEGVAQSTEIPNLRVITTGSLPPNPAELLGSQRMRNLVERLKDAADLVIFDSPPLLAVADAAILSSFLDGTLLVVDSQRSRRRAVRLAGPALARAGATVLGVVLNRMPSRVIAGYHGYYGEDASQKAVGEAAR